MSLDAGFVRADLQEFLDGRGIDTRTIWTGNVTRQPMLGGVDVRVPDDGLVGLVIQVEAQRAEARGRADDAGLRLEEDDRILRNGRVGLLGVVDIIESDGDELGGRRHAGAEPRLAFNQRKFLRVEFLELGQSFDERADFGAEDLIDFVVARILDQLAGDGIACTPRGVIVVAAPWNFPYAIPANGVVGALRGRFAHPVIDSRPDGGSPTDARTQIAWGLSYIAGRWGTPMAAWNHFQYARWY